MAAWTDFPQWADRFLFLLAPESIFKARVNQGSFVYPLAQVTFDTVSLGAFGDIIPGMTVLFGSSEGADDLGRQRMRTAATSTNIFIGWSSQGIRDGEVKLADGAYITVLNDYRAWAKIPRITLAGTLFKDFDIPAAIGTPSPPVANGGEPVLQFIDSGTELITIDFDGTNSFTTAPGATISTYAWDFVDGTPSSSAASTVAGVTFPKGFRWVALTVTDSNTKQHTTRIPVAAVFNNYIAEISYSGATITSSSELSASYLDDYAFDGDTGTRWLGDGNSHWIQIQLASAQTIIHYSLDQTTMGTAAADTAILKGSNNGSTFTTLDTRTGLAGAEVVHDFEIQSPGSYSYYRLELTSSGIYVGARELDLKASSSNVITQFEVSNQQLTRSGSTITFDIFEDIDIDTYPDGTLVLYGENDYYDGVQDNLFGPTDREGLRFSGWHIIDPARLQSTEQSYLTTTQLTCVDIGGRMRQLPAFEQAVLRDTSPTSWLQLDDANTDRYIHYLLHWHSTVLEVSSFTWSGTGETYALPRFASPGQNLWEQVEFRAQSMAYVLTISQRGAIGITVDPLLQDSGDRTATVIVDITATEWGEIGYTHQRPPRIYWDWGDAIIANTQEADASNLAINAAFCVAPGKAPGQGQAETTTSQQIVADQDELNAREGHRYAGRLNPFETLFEVRLVPGGDIGIDPSRMVWVRLTIPADLASQRGLSFTNERFLVFAVDIIHNPETGSKELLLQLERETEGTPAATVIPETGDVLPDIPDIADWPYIYDDDIIPDLFRGQANICAFDDSGLLHVTNDFNTPEASGGPTWATTDLTGLSPALGGDVLSVVGDPFSPLYLGSGVTVNGWILTTTGIYSITDMFGVSSGPTLALQHTLATANPDNGLIMTGVGVQNWVLASAYYSTAGQGTIAIRTTTGGSTWTEATITPHFWTGAEVGGRQPPLWVSSKTAGLAYAGAYVSSATRLAPGDLYKSTDHGATWALAGTPDVDFNGTNGGTLQFPWHDNAAELMVYSTHSDPNVTNIFYRTEQDGITLTDVSPIANAAPRKWWACSVCPIDRQRVAIAAAIVGAQGAIFVSKDAGDSWTQATSTVAAADRYEGIAIAVNDSDVIYAWGNKLQISYSQDFGQTWEDKTTKLSGSTEVVVIIGG